MEKTKQIVVNDWKFELHVPTLRSKIELESNMARSTGGSAALMRISSDTCREAAELAYKLAYCSTLAVKLGSDGKPDYDFSFYELDEEEVDLVETVYKELTDFVTAYKNGRGQVR